MADHLDQDIQDIPNLGSPNPDEADDGFDAVPDTFDEDIYLRAFPDVAQAIADGSCTSPLHHYMEHGRHEDRIARDTYVTLLLGRTIGGHIDFHGHNTLAGGWIFCGWVAERWDETKPVRVTAQFQSGDIAGACITAFYRRDGLQGLGFGVVLFVQGMNELIGNLTALQIRAGGETLRIEMAPGSRAIGDHDVAASVRQILQSEPGSTNCEELLVLLSTGGYGRLRHPLNRLDGFVDMYGYHIASGGWFFVGWVTRTWDRDMVPDDLLVRFMEGNFHSSEVVTGFYARDDIEGRGVGFVMFVPGFGRPLGGLTSVEIQLGGVSSFIRSSGSTQRVRDADLGGRLRPIIANIGEQEASMALLAYLARHVYTGVDTLGGLAGPVLLGFDEVIACPPGGLIIMGWSLAKPGIIRAFRLRSSAMNEPVDFESCIRIQRPDVIASVGAEHGFDDPRCGFIVYIPFAGIIPNELYMEVETAQREVGYRKLPPSKLTGIAAIKRLLNTIDARYGEIPLAFDRTIGTAVGHLNDRRLAIPPKADMIEFGHVNPSPRFSVIIPLYGRLDFIEYQLAFLSSHKAAADYEFIYVLDDPPKRREAERLFSSAYARFQIPFRAVLMEQNMGFAPANNVGLRAARGTYICYLNSDVFPGPNDWLERLAEQMELNPDLGTVGPTLLYGDGSIQHEGMTFRQLPEFGNWLFPDHINKGMRRTLMPGLVRHIGITGACMLLRREVAVALGGFDESFIIGDFEDTDLCLRLHLMGLNSAVVTDVAMFHLERKSQAGSAQAWRMNLTLYNAWVHEKRWAETIRSHPLCNGPAYDLSDMTRATA